MFFFCDHFDFDTCVNLLPVKLPCDVLVTEDHDIHTPPVVKCCGTQGQNPLQ